MKPTHLYVKQHSVSGLKYFGKTTKKNPLKYMGSGKYWKKHIKKHGTEHVITVWSQLFFDENELTEYATKFSKENNIVDSDEWANLKEENGLDGGRTAGFTAWNKGIPNTETPKRMLVENPMSNTAIKEKHKRALNLPKELKRKSESKKGNTNTKNRTWCNNGTQTKMLFECPHGWKKGRLNPHWNHKRKNNEEAQ